MSAVLVVKASHRIGKMCSSSTRLFGLGSFILPFSHICNIGHVNYRSQFTTHLIIYGHSYNTI